MKSLSDSSGFRPVLTFTRLTTTAAAVSLLLSACAVGPDYKRPDYAMPDHFESAGDVATASALSNAQTPAIPRDWWMLYGDARLNALIDMALKNNADVRLAVARVEEAEATLREADASFFPEIDLGASGSKTRSSALNAQTFPGPLVQKNNSLVLSTSFELDFWGRLRRASESARAQALATRYAQDVTTLTLAGSIAQGYFGLRSLDAQLIVAQNSLDAQDESLGVVRNRAKAGLASDLDLNQAQAARADVATQLRELQRQRAVQVHVLQSLTGDLSLKFDAEAPAPSASTIESTPSSPPLLMRMPMPPLPPPGLPSSLMDRRPDVQQAEQALVSANALIGVARANQLPTFSLTGSTGGQSEALANVLKSGAHIWSVGLGATMPLFDAGKYAARTREAEARQRQSAASYQKAIDTAFKEVADALSNVELANVSEADIQAKAEAARNALRLATLRYKAGYAAYLDVLDAQRTANAAEAALVQNRQARLAYSVDLIKALGGGWAAE